MNYQYKPKSESSMIWGIYSFTVDFSLNQMLYTECVSKLFNCNFKLVTVDVNGASVSYIIADKSECWKSYPLKLQLSPEPCHPNTGINCPLPADWEPSHCWWEIQLISTEFILATAGAQYDVWRGTVLLQKSIIPPSHTSELCLAPILQSWLYGHRIGTNAAETCSSLPYTCLCQINLVQTSAKWESVQ